MSRIIVLGAGGFGRAVAELIMLLPQYELAGFVDDRWPDLGPVWAFPVLGRLVDLPRLRNVAEAAVAAIGDGPARQSAFATAAQAGFELPNIIHPRAHISPSATLGRGLVVMAGAIVGTESVLGDGAIVNAGAVLDHQARIGAFALLGVGACLGGAAWLDEHASLSPGEALATGQRRSAASANPSLSSAVHSTCR